MNIPSIIKQQLVQTNIIIVGTWGAHKWTALSTNTLAFRVQARRLNGIITITLDERQDLYNISFYSNKSFEILLKKPLKKFEDIQGVYYDQLLYLIDEQIEKAAKD
jgi:hypothetical protein